jgi:hypothetical protein
VAPTHSAPRFASAGGALLESLLFFEKLRPAEFFELVCRALRGQVLDNNARIQVSLLQALLLGVPLEVGHNPTD